MMSAVWAAVRHALPFMYLGSTDKPGEMREKVCPVPGRVGSQWGGPQLLYERAFRNDGQLNESGGG